MAAKYPHIVVKLIGADGNAFMVLGLVRKALRDNGVSAEEVAEFYKQATAGDYDHLLGVVQEWVNVGSVDDDDYEDDDEDDTEWDADDDDEDDYCLTCGRHYDDCDCDEDERD